MAIGTYGITRPADVNIDDIDIYYNYIPNRETENTEIIKIDDVSELLSYTYLPDEDSISGNENILEGLYNLKLPATIFGDLGIYTLYIKPKRITVNIIDCGVLSSSPTVKGIVLDGNDLSEFSDKLISNNALQGYRVEYINSDGTKQRNLLRYVVSSNKVSPVSENIGNSNQKSIRYRFDDDGSLIFLQLTPTSSSNIKSNVLPYIGKPEQTIVLSNTFFNPLMLEIEMVENTIDTLTELVAGEQVKDVRNGILTYYDKNRVITKQFNLFEIKDDVTDVPLFEVKEKRENIDNNQDFDDVVGDIE